MSRPSPGSLRGVLGVVLCLFTLAEVNYPRLGPQAELAIFAGLGLVLCFLQLPLHPRLADHRGWRWLDRLLAATAAACCLYVVVQTEPAFASWWPSGQALGNRAGHETQLDILVGVLGLALVLEATRRSLGAALPLLSLVFLAYAYWGPQLPAWLFPHRGYGVERIVSQTFLHSQGVFGIALGVMLTYVFLFLIFGAFLQATGATDFILRFARRMFHGSSGGPAKVAVLSSGLMGSLSGSAVANTATTGTFTIPMMRSTGLAPHVAGGIEAAASSGGALMPPVMGAGAYMMLEIIDPPVTYLDIIRAALFPALLYYLSLFFIVHFYARRASSRETQLPGHAAVTDAADDPRPLPLAEGAVFVAAFIALIGFLFLGYTAFRAVSLALGVIVLVAAVRPHTRLSLRRALEALVQSARDVVPLICASACVGVVLGVVTLTGIGSRLPAAILPLAESNLLLALVAIMVSSIVLGMGLPSAVCYLLMATLIGPVLSQLGVVPLAAHLFIFYFGMMSMVTPPVALAAYAAGSIAGASILRTGMAAFRFALVGFALPFTFVLRPELLMLDAHGQPAPWSHIALAVAAAALGTLPFAAGIAGFLHRRLGLAERILLVTAGLLLLLPGPILDLGGVPLPTTEAAGIALLVAMAWFDRRRVPVVQG